MTTTSATQTPGHTSAPYGLAIVRLTIGAMFVSVFFENLGKGLYNPKYYAELINGYIQHGHAPALWKSVMALTAAHASVAAPGQGFMEITVGVLLVLGLFTRPVAFVAFAFLGGLWMSELGTSWIWELLVPIMGALGLVVGRAGRVWGVDAILARRNPSSLFW